MTILTIGQRLQLDTRHHTDIACHLAKQGVQVHLLLHAESCTANQSRQHAAAQLGWLGGAVVQAQLVQGEQLADTSICVLGGVVNELHNTCSHRHININAVSVVGRPAPRITVRAKLLA